MCDADKNHKRIARTVPVFNFFMTRIDVLESCVSKTTMQMYICGAGSRGEGAENLCRKPNQAIGAHIPLCATVARLCPLPLQQVFRRLARPAGAREGGGHSAARDNALVFLRGHLGPPPSGWDRDRRKAFRKRVKGACRLIEAIVTADELG